MFILFQAIATKTEGSGEKNLTEDESKVMTKLFHQFEKAGITPEKLKNLGDKQISIYAILTEPEKKIAERAFSKLGFKVEFSDKVDKSYSDLWDECKNNHQDNINAAIDEFVERANINFATTAYLGKGQSKVEENNNPLVANKDGENKIVGIGISVNELRKLEDKAKVLGEQIKEEAERQGVPEKRKESEEKQKEKKGEKQDQLSFEKSFMVGSINFNGKDKNGGKKLDNLLKGKSVEYNCKRQSLIDLQNELNKKFKDYDFTVYVVDENGNKKEVSNLSKTEKDNSKNWTVTLEYINKEEDKIMKNEEPNKYNSSTGTQGTSEVEVPPELREIISKIPTAKQSLNALWIDMQAKKDSTTTNFSSSIPEDRIQNMFENFAKQNGYIYKINREPDNDTAGNWKYTIEFVKQYTGQEISQIITNYNKAITVAINNFDDSTRTVKDSTKPTLTGSVANILKDLEDKKGLSAEQKDHISKELQLALLGQDIVLARTFNRYINREYTPEEFGKIKSSLFNHLIKAKPDEIHSVVDNLYVFLQQSKINDSQKAESAFLIKSYLSEKQSELLDKFKVPSQNLSLQVYSKQEFNNLLKEYTNRISGSKADNLMKEIADVYNKIRYDNQLNEKQKRKLINDIEGIISDRFSKMKLIPDQIRQGTGVEDKDFLKLKDEVKNNILRSTDLNKLAASITDIFKKNSLNERQINDLKATIKEALNTKQTEIMKLFNDMVINTKEMKEEYRNKIEKANPFEIGDKLYEEISKNDKLTMDQKREVLESVNELLSNKSSNIVNQFDPFIKSDLKLEFSNTYGMEGNALNSFKGSLKFGSDTIDLNLTKDSKTSTVGVKVLVNGIELNLGDQDKKIKELLDDYARIQNNLLNLSPVNAKTGSVTYYNKKGELVELEGTEREKLAKREEIDIVKEQKKEKSEVLQALAYTIYKMKSQQSDIKMRLNVNPTFENKSKIVEVGNNNALKKGGGAGPETPAKGMEETNTLEKAKNFLITTIGLNEQKQDYFFGGTAFGDSTAKQKNYNTFSTKQDIGSLKELLPIVISDKLPKRPNVTSIKEVEWKQDKEGNNIKVWSFNVNNEEHTLTLKLSPPNENGYRTVSLNYK